MASLAARGVEVFGYVPLGRAPEGAGLDDATLFARAANWSRIGVTGVFWDEAGLDYDVDRARLRLAVEATHAAGMRAFVNAWSPDDVLAGGTPLRAGDLYLAESWLVGGGRAQDAAAWATKADRMLALRAATGVRMVALATGDTTSAALPGSLREYAWWGAALYGLDAFGFTDPCHSACAADADELPGPYAPPATMLGTGFVDAEVRHLAGSLVHERGMVEGRILLAGDAPGGAGGFVPWLPAGTNGAHRPATREYPHHENVSTTIFWIGEPPTPDNGFIANTASAWDELWLAHYGGPDAPWPRWRHGPAWSAAAPPRENPFYAALPYNDIGEDGARKSDADEVVPWAHERAWGDDESMVKNRWLRIEANGRVAYAQWEDAGPFGEDDAAYVFGSAPPANPENEHAGLDVSPAVRDALGLPDGIGRASWRFVDDADVPAGPWREVVTTSGLCYLPDCLTA